MNDEERRASALRGAAIFGFSPQEYDNMVRRRTENKPRGKEWGVTDWLKFSELAEYENFGGSNQEFWERHDRLEGLARARYITAQKANRLNVATQDVPWVEGEFRIIGGPVATR